MKKLTGFIIAIVSFNGLHAQEAQRQEFNTAWNNSSLSYTFQTTEVHGTQFLVDDWQIGNITTDRGATFRDVSLRFDVYNNKFVFNRNDSMYELGPAVKTVCLFPTMSDTTKKMLFKKGYAIDNHFTPAKYAEVLAEGRITLLRYYTKDIEEYTEFGNANKLKRFVDVQHYYVLADNQFTHQFINRKNLEQVLQAKWAQVEPWMKQNKVSGKDAASWAAAINYYNSL